MKHGPAPGIPPYVPYIAFRDFLARIGKRLPARIDKGVMQPLSAVMQSQLMGALRFLALVDPSQQPTETLVRIVKSDGPERQKVIQEMLTASYPSLFQDVDLQRTTRSVLEKKFKETGASGDTVRKCLAFFVAACREADISLSPYIKPFQGARRTSARRSRPPIEASPDKLSSSALKDRNTSEPSSDRTALPWQQLLLSKLPSIDPSWSDETKTKWLDDLSRLLKVAEENESRHPSRKR